MNRKEATKLGKHYFKDGIYKHDGRVSYNFVRAEIEKLDVLIESENNVNKKIEYINDALMKNYVYIYLPRRPIPAKVVFCVILSIFFLLGLIIFLPGIIIRNKKSDICISRINKLETKKSILVQKS